MMQKLYLNILLSFLLAVSLILAACVPAPFTSGALHKQLSLVPSKASQTLPIRSPAQRKAVVESLKLNRQRALQLVIDPSMGAPVQGFNPVDLSPYLNSNSAFSTQAVPEGAIVFQETFTKGR